MPEKKAWIIGGLEAERTRCSGQRGASDECRIEFVEFAGGRYLGDVRNEEVMAYEVVAKL